MLHPGDEFLMLVVRVEGRAVSITVHTSTATAYAFLTAWCRGSWSEQGHEDDPLPADDRDAIDHYYKFWRPEEGFDLRKGTVDPDLADMVF